MVIESIRRIIHPVLILIVVWLFFAAPYYGARATPFPSDYQVNTFAPWSAYGQFAGPVKNAAMPDLIGQIVPWKMHTIRTWQSGEVPLWNPYSFSGTPHLANYQSAVFTPFNLLFFILPFFDAWTLLVLLAPLFAGIGMYLWTRRIGQSQTASLLSSISWMFCGFITCWMGYATLTYAILWLPYALYAIESFFQTGKVRYIAVTTATVPLSFFSGHFQISMYYLIGVGAYIALRGITSRMWRITGVITCGVICGMSMSLIQLLPTIEAYGQSLRSNLFAKVEVIPWQNLLTFIAPDVYGHPVTRNDWFGHYAEWNGFIGTVGLVLALSGVWFIVSRIMRKQANVYHIYALILLAGGLWLTYPTYLVDVMVALKIPGLSTSAASRAIVLASFALSACIAFGYDAIVREIHARRFSWSPIVIASALVAILWGVIGLRLGLSEDTYLIARSNALLPTAMLISVIIAVFISAAIIRTRQVAIGIFLLSALLVVMTSFDMLRFTTKWQPFDPVSMAFIETPVMNVYQNLKDESRVIGNLGAEVGVWYQAPLIEGYDALYIRRYGQWVTYTARGSLEDSSRSVVQFPRGGAYGYEGLQLLGARYVIHKESDGRFPWTYPYWTYPEDALVQLWNDDSYRILANNAVYPRAFLVGQYEIIHDQTEALNRLYSSSFDRRNSILLENDPGMINGNSFMVSDDAAKITRYTANSVQVSVNVDRDSLLYLSDAWYPGWYAYVDGRKTDVLRANTTFRAVAVPAGTSEVVFRYEPESFRWGIIGATIGLIGIMIVCFYARKTST